MINKLKMAFSSMNLRRGANDAKIVRAYNSASTNQLFNLEFIEIGGENNMAISMKNLDDRLKVLENSSGGIIESSLTNPGYVKFGNGLIINFGSVSSGGVGFVNIPFKKPFNTVIACSAAMVRNSGAGDYRSIGALSTTSVNVCKDGSSKSLFIAIGY